ncbi:HGGxSTG domain-containing protein [Altererythrobacter ishigakiensis]|uniref:Glucans biosynthesis protein n=2 Tax=Altererythrobacter ishigakiensis TaxID=476157 RepID=A0A562USM4_9SPHN|nr:hypothetical protein JN10_0237 [Altererythrobacter ishigakiensis]
MRQSLRCGARTRMGLPCQAPAVRGKKRCRMHGGAQGSGAPIGNRNAHKHGVYAREAQVRSARMRSLLKHGEQILDDFLDSRAEK